MRSLLRGKIQGTQFRRPVEGCVKVPSLRVFWAIHAAGLPVESWKRMQQTKMVSPFE